MAFSCLRISLMTYLDITDLPHPGFPESNSKVEVEEQRQELNLGCVCIHSQVPGLTLSMDPKRQLQVENRSEETHSDSSFLSASGACRLLVNLERRPNRKDFSSSCLASLIQARDSDTKICSNTIIFWKSYIEHTCILIKLYKLKLFVLQKLVIYPRKLINNYYIFY